MPQNFIVVRMMVKSSARSAASIEVQNSVQNAVNNCEKNLDEDVSVLLTNKNGCYSLFSAVPASRYEGVFFRSNGKMIKIIESFLFSSQITFITNNLWGVALKRGELSQTMFMPLNHDALVVELGAVSEFELVLDVKISEDNRVWGREYEVFAEDKTIVVKFSKKNDGRDDNSVHREEFEVYLALHSSELEYLPLQVWEEHFYKLDEVRNSSPFSRWVFKACKVRAKDFVCAWSLSKKDAIAAARDVFESRDRLKRERENHVHSLISGAVKVPDAEVSLARQCAINALDCLVLNNSSILAGLPWFYQRWARDELISVKSLMILKNFALAKKILFSYLPQVNNEGLLPNMIDSETSLLSIDAVGWLFFRINELLFFGAKNKSFSGVSKKDKDFVIASLKNSLFLIRKNRLKNGLVFANCRETWMDTEFGGDTREGCCIEIQAMVLFMLKMLRKLTGKNDAFESELASAVRKNFVHGQVLLDVAGSAVVRPNFFIAAYFYPELFSEKEWSVFVDSAISRLWLDWGGFSSIDKKSPLFVDVYSGENNASYHRGDSWFWLNNLSAIVMHQVNAAKFRPFVSKILKANACEILYKGATGFAAEVSSAKELSSKGCVAQSWSAATFVELVNELFGK